jgi:hypothetical protein
VLKREGRLAEALDLWEWMLKPFGHLPFAYIELAKHHEHICKNAGIAVEYTHRPCLLTISTGRQKLILNTALQD